MTLMGRGNDLNRRILEGDFIIGEWADGMSYERQIWLMTNINNKMRVEADTSLSYCKKHFKEIGHLKGTGNAEKLKTILTMVWSTFRW